MAAEAVVDYLRGIGLLLCPKTERYSFLHLYNRVQHQAENCGIVPPMGRLISSNIREPVGPGRP